jgi:hypothetical protein
VRQDAHAEHQRHSIRWRVARSFVETSRRREVLSFTRQASALGGAAQRPPPEVLQQIDAQRPSLLPTSEKISKLAEMLLGQPHEPGTDYGKAAYTVGEKLPLLPVFTVMRRF